MRCLGALMLAVGLGSGCGVGADESPAALGVTTQAADSPATTAASPPADSSEGTTSDGSPHPLPGAPPTVVALPQDPIPLFLGQPVAPVGVVLVAPAATTPAVTAPAPLAGH